MKAYDAAVADDALDNDWYEKVTDTEDVAERVASADDCLDIVDVEAVDTGGGGPDFDMAAEHLGVDKLELVLAVAVVELGVQVAEFAEVDDVAVDEKHAAADNWVHEYHFQDMELQDVVLVEAGLFDCCILNKAQWLLQAVFGG